MNDSRHPDPRIEPCHELAHRLADDEGLRTVRLLGLVQGLAPFSGYEAPPNPVAEGASPDATGHPVPIRIWRPRQTETGWCFERPVPHPLGDHYSARRSFSLDKPSGVRRVLLFGESAAAGYLLAPHWTPAQALEQRLRDLAGGPDVDHGAFEVIDLARTNDSLDSMTAVLEPSLQLAPDVLVVFAGNNWNLLERPEAIPFARSVVDRQRFALHRREGGEDAAVAWARRRLRQRVEDAMATFAEAAERCGARVVLLVPEVDLDLWEVRQPLGWTTIDGGVARWHALYREAREHLDHQRFAEALAVAQAMLRLDGGSQVTSHRLRARAYRGLGVPEAAQQAAEEAVDAAASPRLGFLGAPQADSQIKGWLRQAAERHQLTLVDLPWLLAGKQPPGDEIFLDYCHLGVEGIDRVMTATAVATLESLGLDRCPEAIKDLEPLRPPPAVVALSQLGAAIHGAHRHLAVSGRGSGGERWLRRALATDPSILDTLVDLAQARCGPLPAVLGEGQLRQLAKPWRLLLQHGWRWDHLDADLLRDLLTVLDEVAPEQSEAAKQKLSKYHGANEIPRDLSRAPYLWQPLARFLPEVMEESEASRRATLRVPWGEVAFVLVADGDHDLSFDLVARLPPIEGWAGERSGEVTVLVDGVEVATLACGETWTRHGLKLERRYLGGILHRLVLRWPDLPAADTAALDAALERLEMGREADLFPVFGEVQRLAVGILAEGG